MKDDIYNLACTILKVKGVLGTIPARIHATYDDDKVSIEGLWPIDYIANDEPYDQIGIAINMNPQMMVKPFPPNLKLGTSTQTVVYYWGNGIRHYYRPGHWVKYLKRLVDEINREAEENTRLDGTPVDDGELFPDLLDQ